MKRWIIKLIMILIMTVSTVTFATTLFAMVSSISSSKINHTHDLQLSEIINSNDLQILKDKIATLPNNALVIFDVDDVLITTQDQIFHHKNKPQFEIYKKKVKKALGKKGYIDSVGVLFRDRKTKVVDQQILQILEILKQKHIKTIALTFAGTEKIGPIPSLADWRVKQLADHGIHFTDAFPKEKSFILGEQSPKNYGKPLFKSGIIFTAGHDKGIILKKFLNKIHYKPTMILFVDDKMNHLTSVQAVAKSLHIPFIGIHYTTVINENLPPLNKERVELQVNTLIKEKKWLGDEEINSIVETK